jgi:hypothetical protein
VKPPRALLLALLLAALALAACGGDEEPAPEVGPTADTAVEPGGEAGTEAGQTSSGGGSGPSDEERIEAAIVALLTSPEAKEVCDDAVTGEFLRRAYGDRAGCAAALDPAALARKVEVRGLEIKGDSASAVIRPEGGVYDGERLDVALVREGDAWKVDRLEADVPVGP